MPSLKPKKRKWSQGDWKLADTSIVTERVCIAVIEDDGGYQASPEKRKANANLLVSAPKLYEALEAVMESGVNLPDSVLKKVIESMNKAHGVEVKLFALGAGVKDWSELE